MNILNKNQDSKFGQDYKFSEITSIKEFENQVPISDYDQISPYIDKLIDGDEKALTEEKVDLLHFSSGSTSKTKLIPFTKSLKIEFLKAIRPWLFNLFNNRKKIMCGKQYWVITPPGKVVVPETGSIKAGFDDDGDYFNLIEKLILNSLSAVPFEVATIKDIETFRYVTLLFLVSEENLRMISVWHPSFLILLLENLPELLPDMIHDIRSGAINKCQMLQKKLKASSKRANELDKILKNSMTKQELFLQTWKHLQLVSCWTDAASRQSAEQLSNLLPNVEIQGKGLMATEGFISFPMIGKGNILAVNSHFYEFMDIETNGIEPVYKLKTDKDYEVIITTSGGLYRYRLHDIVRVKEFKNGVPLLEFIGKNDYISDMVGEKLNALFVKNALDKIFKTFASFIMLAPEQNADELFYTLFISTEQDDSSIATKLEAELLNNYNYAYCRKLNQLSHVKVFKIHSSSNPMNIYNQRKLSIGTKQGSIKYSYLDKNTNWSNYFVDC